MGTPGVEFPGLLLGHITSFPEFNCLIARFTAYNHRHSAITDAEDGHPYRPVSRNCLANRINTLPPLAKVVLQNYNASGGFWLSKSAILVVLTNALSVYCLPISSPPSAYVPHSYGAVVLTKSRFKVTMR